MYFNIYFLIFLCTLFTHMLLKNERMHFLYIDLSQCTFCQRFRWFVKWPAICCPLFFWQLFCFILYVKIFIFLNFIPNFFVNFCNLCIIFQVKLKLLHSSKANSFISLKRSICYLVLTLCVAHPHFKGEMPTDIPRMFFSFYYRWI